MAWIFRYFLLLEIARNYVQTTDWVDNVTRYITEESGARQALLIRNREGSKDIASPIINEVFVKLGQKFPIMTVNIADDQDEPNISCADAAGDPIPLATSATFYLLIHDFRDAGIISPPSSFIDAVAEMTSFDYHPRYLLLYVAPVLSESLEELLQYAWTKKMLDLTILQWIEPGISGHSETANHEFSLPIVHQLNPFKQEYRRSKWSSNNGGLFPNKVGDMAGYPLRVMVSNSPPFSVSEFNEFDKPIFVGGANVLLIQSIARKLNASLEYLPYKQSKNPTHIKPSDRHTYMYEAGEACQMDISASLRKRASTSKCAGMRTIPITVDELCAVVPILIIPKRFDLKDLFFALLFIVGVVVIYCIVARVLRLSVFVWQPFNITRVFFGVSASQQPRRTVERVMLASLLAISFIYSSHIYSALTGINVSTTGEMVFETIEDLDNSGLIPVLGPFNFNKTFQGAEGALKTLMNRSIASVDGVLACVQQVVRNRNVACFADKSRLEVLVSRSTTDGHPTIKLAKPCFSSESVAFHVGKMSPYRFFIDIVISRMQNAGLINKLYEDAKDEGVKRIDNEDDRVLEGQQSMITFRRQFLTLAICCYTISLLVFIGEIVVHRVSKHIKSKRQAIVHIPYTE